MDAEFRIGRSCWRVGFGDEGVGGLEGCAWKDGRSEREDMAAVDIDARIQLDIDIAMLSTTTRMGC